MTAEDINKLVDEVYKNNKSFFDQLEEIKGREVASSFLAGYIYGKNNLDLE